eukprot:366496-Chlamydomonas_euryale.AAC.25
MDCSMVVMFAAMTAWPTEEAHAQPLSEIETTDAETFEHKCMPLEWWHPAAHAAIDDELATLRKQMRTKNQPDTFQWRAGISKAFLNAGQSSM